MLKADLSFTKLSRQREERIEVKRHARIKGKEKQKEKERKYRRQEKVRTEK